MLAGNISETKRKTLRVKPNRFRMAYWLYVILIARETKGLLLSPFGFSTEGALARVRPAVFIGTVSSLLRQRNE